MAQGAGESIPKACGSWAEVMGAYRLLSNGAVDAQALQMPHRELTRKACAALGVVLAISDITDLDFTGRRGVRGLGRLGDGGGEGLQQHTTLAVTTAGEVIGVLRQDWYTRPEAPRGETRAGRRSRWCESDTWADAAREIGTVASCRVIHVADRGADIFSFMQACEQAAAGFLIRAQHDRRIAGGEHEYLWARVAAEPVQDRFEVEVSAQRNGPARDRRGRRKARVSVRACRVTIRPPRQDPRCAKSPPREVSAVHVLEEEAPRGEGVAPVEWMLLTSEPAGTAAEARRLVEWYSRRWVIEEFHRVEKEGCRLEATQLDDAQDIKRLAAITGVIAVRLLRLRDLADPGHAQADNPAALRELADAAAIGVVAALTGLDAAALTPRQFLDAVARRGGWLGRRRDPRPGWKCLWRGWREVTLMAQGAVLVSGGQRCV